jgi:hypothetical protein
MASTITGNIKILRKNFLIDYTNSIALSSGSLLVDHLYDFDRSTRWISSGSDDSTQESIEIEWDLTLSVDRICLLNMNWKQFSIQYWNGSAYVDFANVYSYKTDSPATGITITGNADLARYFEFDQVQTKKIKILIDTTQTVDSEKYIYELYVGSEMGTFIDDLHCKPNQCDLDVSNKNSKYITKSNGGSLKITRSDKVSFKVKIKELWNQTDIQLIQAMHDYGEFAVYPCGAYSGAYTIERGYRIQDLYHVLIKGDEESIFAVGRDKNLGQDFKFDLLEL